MLNKYNIDIFKLSNSVHTYEFEVDDVFFQQFENSLIEKGQLHIEVTLTKSATFIEMQFKTKGSVELVCDRSLEKFTEEISSNDKMLFKFGDHWEELSDEIVLIPHDEQKINIGQYVYEFISLGIPMKKLHPKFRDQEDEGIIFSSDKAEKEKTSNDPRWDKLKGLIK